MMETKQDFTTIYNVLQESPYAGNVARALKAFHAIENAFRELQKPMEYVYRLQYRTPDMKRGEWNGTGIFESEDAVKCWFETDLNWYHQQGALYAKSHFANSNKPVTYRVTKHYLHRKA